jgi:hypothetical protein
MHPRFAFIRIDGGSCDTMLLPLRSGKERKTVRHAATGKSPASAGRRTATGSSNHSRRDPIRSAAGRSRASRPHRRPRNADAPHARERSATTRRRSPPTARASPSSAPSTRATSDIHIVSINGGTPTRVTWDNQDLVGLDWSADGKSIVYCDRPRRRLQPSGASARMAASRN